MVVHSPVKVLPEGATDTVQGDWVCAAVGERQTEPDHAANVPEGVIIVLRCWAVESSERKETTRRLSVSINFNLTVIDFY